MKITLYGIMGALGHEKTPIWVDIKPNNTHLTAEVDIPDNLTPCETESGHIAVELGGIKYMLNEVLDDKDGDPIIAWYPTGSKEYKSTITLN